MATNPESTYANWSILEEAIQAPRQLAAFVFCIAVACLTFRRSWTKSDDYSKAARILVASSIICLTWAFSTYSYNYWYDQWHTIERVLLIILGIATIWRPCFICLWAFLLSLIVGQFSHPLNYSWTDKVLLVEFAYLAAVFQTVRGFAPKIKMQSFVFAALVLCSAFYFTTGLAKLRIDWFVENVPENIVFGAWYQNGWLGFLGERGVQQLMEIAAQFGGILKAFVFIAELGALLVLFNKRIAIPVLLSLAMMHVAIFALTGICFWKWFVFDIALIVAIGTFPKERSAFFHLNSGIVGVGLVAIFVLTCDRLVWLGWYDSQLAFRYTVVATGDGGQEYEVPTKHLAPYDLPFAQGRFYQVTETPQLVDCLGAVVDLERYEALSSLVERVSESAKPQHLAIEGVSQLRARYGDVRYDVEQSQVVDSLLNKWLASNNNSAYKSIPLAPPKHIWTIAHEDNGLAELQPGQPVRAVGLKLSEALHWGGQHTVVLHESAIAERIATSVQEGSVR